MPKLSLTLSGKGTLVGADVIMETPQQGMPIEGLGFYTSNVDGEWEFTEVDDGTMDISVSNVYSYHQASVLTNGPSILFKVRAKEDARILLMEVYVGLISFKYIYNSSE